MGLGEVENKIAIEFTIWHIKLWTEFNHKIEQIMDSLKWACHADSHTYARYMKVA